MGENASGETEEQAWRRIEESIASSQSPVGIDAKHTHIMILRALERIEARLERLEREADPDGR